MMAPSSNKTSWVSRHKLLLATAFLWWLSGAFQIFPLGWIALAPFFFSLEGLPKAKRFRVGYATGFVSFALINWWLVPTITMSAATIHAPVVLGFFLSIISVVFIAAVHAFQPALVALLWGGDARLRPLIVALAWSMGDYVRTLTSFAHEWGAMAFSQTSDLPLLQLAHPLGQHGLTFFCVFFAACVALWWPSRQKVWLVLPILTMVGVHVWGFIQLQEPITGKKLHVLIVQTAVASLSKSVGATGEGPHPQAFRLTSEGMKKNGGAPFDLIVWPETTANYVRVGPLYNGLDWQEWRLEGPKIPLLAGSLTRDEKNLAWNEAVLIEPNGQVQTRAKTRLVPFGERAPLVEYLPFLQIFAPDPMVEPGDGTKTFQLPGKTTIDTQICFESCFPQRVQGKLLVMITNDEWFTGTEAPRQHRAMAIIRAVENGVPLVQSANGGYSFVVTAKGQVLMASQYGLPQTLDATILVPESGTK